MGFQSDIVGGLRALLLAEGLPSVVVGPFRADDSRAVSLTPMPVGDELTTGVSWLAVRVLIRRPIPDGPNAGYDDQDLIYRVFTSLSYADVGGHVIAGAVRNRSAPSQPDQSGRELIADTYYLTTNRPSS